MNNALSSAINDLHPDLLRYAHYLSDKADTAEELVQQTTERMLNRQGKLSQIEDMQKYMFSIMRNLHNDFLRQKQRDQGNDAELEPVDPQSSPGQKLFCQQVLAGINTLTPAHQEILSLVGGGHSYSQIAEMLDLPLGTAMSRISRARYALRQSIDVPLGESVLQLLAE
ncbi:MAG: RNA polymerase sigma factor [Rhodobacteraceae bacterium]|nr:RNA polymerase sigma factor [Paracoccaceae bacterium]